MIKNIIMSSFIFLLPVSSLTLQEVKNESKEIVDINKLTLTNEEEFMSKAQGQNNNTKKLFGVIADNDSAFNDRWDKYHSYYNEDNGIFEFQLPDSYDRIGINTDIKVSSRYDQYYSLIEVVPVGADTLVSSQEIFHLNGTVNKGETSVVGKGTVKTIIDRWGIDNSGYSDITWTMSLNQEGNLMTLQANGYETGDIWATASPIWQIKEFTTAEPGDKEIHKVEGNGAPFGTPYDFQNFIDYYNENLTIETYKIIG